MISAWILSVATVVAAAPDPSPDADRSAYETARARAGRDADSQVDLALWCEARGMSAEKARHLARAILLDPDHARARGLLGFVKHEGRWMRPDDVTRAVDESAESRALLAEYLERRAAAPDDADGQYKLALWCEEKGLTRPMVAHLRRVVQLAPGRDGAWRRLGYKKVGGRWVDPEAEAARTAAREAQEKSDKEWRPRLEKLRDSLTSRDQSRQAEAAADLAAISDPRAVPMLWQVFVKGGDERRQRVAIDVLSRIEAPSASAALAMIAVFSPHAPLRSDAASLLQNRDPREYAGLLAGLIRDEVKYKVKSIDGPGSRGELIVEGPEARVERRYTPAAPVALMPGDSIVRGEDGRTMVRRETGRIYSGPEMTSEQALALAGSSGAAYVPIFEGGAVQNTGIAAAAFSNSLPAPGSAGMAPLFQAAGLSADRSRDMAAGLVSSPQVAPTGVNSSDGYRYAPILRESLQFSLDQALADARASSLAAREQLAADVRSIEAHNAPIRETNERAVAVLKSASGRDLGDESDSWRAWAVDLEGYAYAQKSPTSAPATIVEEVPIAYQAQAVYTPVGNLAGFERRHSCFAAGTMVRTLRGPRAIETILPGDLVLTVDTTSGKLDYRPVVTAFHNPPNETFRIDLGRESIRPTGIHRLWKAGHGWVMARDVKPGDRLRTVGGVVEVAAVEKEPARPVFNLLVDGADDYCVGDSGLIAHDNSFVEPVARPFDLAKAP